MSDVATRELVVIDLGRMPYAAALELQLELVAQRARDAIADHLLFVEHPPVVTVGRGGSLAELAGLELPIVEVARGGEATFHGPGQLVGYPILKLAAAERDLHRYLRDLEEVLIRALADLEIRAVRHSPHTGVWVGDKKLASIGVAVRQWVTYHGFALNVDNDLAPFQSFSPCGLEGSVMSSVAKVVGRQVMDHQALRDSIVRHFAAVFQRVPRAGASSRLPNDDAPSSPTSG